jgi:hypothetical protein
MNPNFLCKEDLLYELRSRGIHCEGDVHSLRKTFRSVVTRELPVDLGFLEDSGVDDLYACIVSRIHELQDIVQRAGTSLPGLVSRVSTRV